MVRGRSFLDGVLHGLGYRFLEYRALDGSNKEDGRDTVDACDTFPSPECTSASKDLSAWNALKETEFDSDPFEYWRSHHHEFPTILR